jgi:hypothetical protein
MRSLAGARRSAVIATVTTAMVRRSMNPMTRRIVIKPIQQRVIDGSILLLLRDMIGGKGSLLKLHSNIVNTMLQITLQITYVIV